MAPNNQNPAAVDADGARQIVPGGNSAENMPSGAETQAALQTLEFNYSTLAPELASDLRGQADRIRKRIANTTINMIEVGRDLLAVKPQLRGRFIPWIESAVGISKRTAQVYMAAARLADEDGKSATVALLPPGTVRMLAAKGTPADLRKTIIARVESGEVIPEPAVADMVAKAASIRREAQHRERLLSRRKSPRGGKVSEGTRARRERALKKQKKELAERKQRATDEARKLIEQIGPATIKKVLSVIDDAGWMVRESIRLELAGAPAAAQVTASKQVVDNVITRSVKRPANSVTDANSFIGRLNGFMVPFSNEFSSWIDEAKLSEEDQRALQHTLHQWSNELTLLAQSMDKDPEEDASPVEPDPFEIPGFLDRTAKGAVAS